MRHHLARRAVAHLRGHGLQIRPFGCGCVGVCGCGRWKTRQPTRRQVIAPYVAHLDASRGGAR